jgi:hypothetical protein
MSDGMNARDAILAGVRRALETADTSPVTVPRGYRDTGPADPSGMLDLFVEGTVALSHRVRPAQQIFLSAPRDTPQTAPSGPAQVVTKKTPCGG